MVKVSKNPIATGRIVSLITHNVKGVPAILDRGHFLVIFVLEFHIIEILEQMEDFLESGSDGECLCGEGLDVFFDEADVLVAVHDRVKRAIAVFDIGVLHDIEHLRLQLLIGEGSAARRGQGDVGWRKRWTLSGAVVRWRACCELGAW